MESVVRVAVALTVAGLWACGGKEAGGQVAGQPETLTYARELKVDLSAMEKRPSGLYVLDIKEGTGQAAAAGQVATVHYSGWLANGQALDSSVGDEPLEFNLGAGKVIAGWDEGIQGMKVGGKRRLVLPPQLAYGDGGAPPVIPPGATLVFDVELLGVR